MPEYLACVDCGLRTNDPKCPACPDCDRHDCVCDWEEDYSDLAYEGSW